MEVANSGCPRRAPRGFIRDVTGTDRASACRHRSSNKWRSALVVAKLVSMRVAIVTVFLLASWCCASVCQAEGPTKQDYGKWIEALVSSNKPPEIGPEYPEAHFTPDFDFRVQQRVLDTWERLNRHVERALPVLIKHLNDERYSLTVQDGWGYDHNHEVGWVCARIIKAHMQVWQYYTQSDAEANPPDDLGRRHLPQDGGFPWHAEVERDPTGREPSLFSLQIKSFDWAIEAQQELWPLRDKQRQAVVLDCLRQRRDELAQSGRPIQCRAYSGEEFSFHIPFELRKKDEEEAGEKSAAAIRDAMMRLASPNLPPTIVRDKAIFPEGYDRTGQQRVVSAIRRLTENFEAAFPALAAAVTDERYCLTLQGANGIPRNVTVGEFCCLLIAANVNVYRPYVRDSEDLDSYPMYKTPTPKDIAETWQAGIHNSLLQIQDSAFRWAADCEQQRGGFQSDHQRDVRLTYLEMHEKELWGCHVPIVVDLLLTQRVVLPHENP